MKKEVKIAIIVIVLLAIGITTYFILKGGGESASSLGGDYSLNDEEVDYAAGADVGDNLAEGTQGNVFDTDTNPFD